MSEIDAHGLAVDVPAGWEGRIFRRAEEGELRAAEVPGEPAPSGERTFPVLHAASIPIPADSADYGSDLVEDLQREDALIVLKEFDPALAADALFESPGMPRELAPTDFDTATLQRSLDGQGGHQTFFNESERAFCLYVVLGDFASRATVVPRVNEVLTTVRIDTPPPAAPG